MDQLITVWLLFSIAMANLPFFNHRLLGCIALPRGYKSTVWRCLEMVVLYFILAGIAYFVERQQGPVHSQHWQFYVVTACLFVIFAFPGIVIHYFWRKRPVATKEQCRPG